MASATEREVSEGEISGACFLLGRTPLAPRLPNSLVRIPTSGRELQGGWIMPCSVVCFYLELYVGPP